MTPIQKIKKIAQDNVPKTNVKAKALTRSMPLTKQAIPNTQLWQVILDWLKNNYGQTHFLHSIVNNKAHSYSGDEAAFIIKAGMLGLRKLGIQKKDHAGIMMSTSPYWFFFDQMLASLGAVNVGIFEETPIDRLQHIIKENKIKVIFLNNETSANSLTAFQKKISLLIVGDHLYQSLITNNNFPDLKVVKISTLLQLGADVLQRNKNAFERHAVVSKNHEIKNILYSSIHNRRTKVSQANILQQIEHISKYIDFMEKDQAITINVPLPHIFTRIFLYVCLKKGVHIHLLPQAGFYKNFSLVSRPTTFITQPHSLTKIIKIIQGEALSKYPLVAYVINKAIAHAQKKSISNQPFLWLFYNFFVYRKIRKNLGYSIKNVVTGLSKVPESTFNFYTNMGIKVFEHYAITEMASFLAASSNKFYKPLAQGRIIKPIQAKLSKKGELFIKSPLLKPASHHDKTPAPAHSAKKNQSITEWFNTGDIADIDNDCFLSILGSADNFCFLNNGKKINLEKIQQLFVKNMFIEHTFATLNMQQKVVVLAFVNIANLNTEMRYYVEGSIAAFIKEISSQLDAHEKIKDYTIIWRPLSIFRSELTPNLTLNKNTLLKTFSIELRKMYIKK